MFKILKIFLIILPLIFSVCSCGFHPVYKDNENKQYQQELAAIKIQKERKLVNQQLRKNLQETLNPYSLEITPKYLLIINLKSSVTQTIVTSSGASGRNKITLNASYQLKDIKSGKVIAYNNTSAKDDFNIGDKRFANYTAQEAIELNLTKLIAQNIRNSLINDISQISK